MFIKNSLFTAFFVVFLGFGVSSSNATPPPCPTPPTPQTYYAPDLATLRSHANCAQDGDTIIADFTSASIGGTHSTITIREGVTLLGNGGCGNAPTTFIGTLNPYSEAVFTVDHTTTAVNQTRIENFHFRDFVSGPISGTFHGGAILAAGTPSDPISSLGLHCCKFSNAGRGSGLYATNIGDLSITANRFISCQPYSFPGFESHGNGLYIESVDNLDVLENYFWGNGGNEYQKGGGMYVDDAKTYYFLCNNFVSNKAGRGGGVYLSNSGTVPVAGKNLFIQNKFSENLCFEFGAGVFSEFGDEIHLRSNEFNCNWAWGNTVIPGSSAGRGGGLCVIETNTVHSENNIYKYNRADFQIHPPVIDCWGTWDNWWLHSMGAGMYVTRDKDSTGPPIDLDIVGDLFLDNETAWKGGGLFVGANVDCDILPNGSVPTTFRDNHMNGDSTDCTCTGKGGDHIAMIPGTSPTGYIDPSTEFLYSGLAFPPPILTATTGRPPHVCTTQYYPMLYAHCPMNMLCRDRTSSSAVALWFEASNWTPGPGIINTNSSDCHDKTYFDCSVGPE